MLLNSGERSPFTPSEQLLTNRERYAVEWQQAFGDHLGARASRVRVINGWFQPRQEVVLVAKWRIPVQLAMLTALRMTITTTYAIFVKMAAC